MINTQKIQLITLFFTCFIVTFPSSILAFDLFGSDEEKGIIWQSGINRYIKYVDQDESRFGKNDHPVGLNSRDIQLALEAIEIPEEGFFSSGETFIKVFTFKQVKLLGEYLVKGLNGAKPGQDIIFLLEKIEKKILGLKEEAFIAGRAFYKDGRLNIIIGDYDYFRSSAFEKAYDPSGRGAVPYTFNHGSRSRASKTFKGVFLNIVGIENKKAPKLRHDWFVIDVKAAAEAYVARREKEQNPSAARQDRKLEIEAAKMARQQRQMRAEMARMRKEMQDISKGENSSSVKSIEERIAILEELRDKKLITQEEYNNKRQEILNDI